MNRVDLKKFCGRWWTEDLTLWSKKLNTQQQPQRQL